jgi:hypothetical protein
VSDEQYLAALVGDAPAPYSVKVVVADYDPVWPSWFAEEADKIRSALGAAALRVEHVGSTSVPGLAAKPIIDIALEVPDSSQEGTYVPALLAAVYDLHIREPEDHEHRCFYTRVERGHKRDVNLHTYTTKYIESDLYAVSATGCQVGVAPELTGAWAGMGRQRDRRVLRRDRARDEVQAVLFQPPWQQRAACLRNGEEHAVGAAW